MTSTITNSLSELQRQFADRLPEQLKTIQTQFHCLELSAWQNDEAETLHRLLHSLSGSAGTFGMISLSNAAQDLESRLATVLTTENSPNKAEWQAIGRDIDQLEQITQILSYPNVPSLNSSSATQHLNDAPLIYLLEDDLAQAEQLSLSLLNNGFRVQVFTELSTFRTSCATMESERPAAVVMDMIFPEGDTAGADMLMELKADQSYCPPVIFVSIRDDLPARLAAFRAGACRYMVKPVDVSHLIDQLDTLTARQPLHPYRVLLVDDEPLLLETYAAILRSAGMIVHTLSQPLQILEAVDDFNPDVVVLDVYMPEANGPELAAVLREREAHIHLPILFLSTETDITQQLLALNLGGDDFLMKPVQAEHLLAAVNARARRVRENTAIQQRLEASLYEREHEHLALNQHAIVSITDLAGNIIYSNDRFCEISGYSRDELLGKNHRIIKSDQHSPEFYLNLWQTITQGNIWQGEICNQRKDGSLYWVKSTITPFLDENGKPYQYMSIRTDITQIKLAEAARLKNEARLNFLVSASPVCIYTCIAKPPFSATYISPNIEQLMGYEPGQFTESPLFWADNIHPDDQPQVFDNLPKLFEHDTHQHDYRYRMPDGSYRWIHDEMRLIRDDSGEAIEIIGYWADITERKNAEDAAESMKERLRQGQIYANIGTWEWNIQTGELFWSERIAPLFGYPASDLETSYDNFIAAVHLDDRQAVIDAVNNSVEHNAPYEIEHRVVWPDGTVRWLLERGAVARDANGNATQMLGVVQDINDRKCAELALVERERQLREAQTLARIGNWMANLTTGELYWSDEIYRIFGYEPGSFTPSVEAFQSMVHPDDRARVAESEKLAEQTGHHDVIHRIVLPDGSVRHVHELAQAETDATGNLLRLTGTVQDITERVEAETQLHETEERFAFAVEGAGDGVWDWNMHTNAMQFSRLYMAMLGYAENELPHHADTWNNSVHPDDMAAAQQNLQDFLENRVPVYVNELRLRCKDGSYKWVLCRGTVVGRDNEGKPTRMIGIHSDITERKQAEQALQENKEKLSGLFELSPLGIALTDMNGAYIEFNDAFQNICGYPSDELFNLDYWTLTPREYETQEAAQLESLIKTGRYGPYEKTYRQKNGNLIPIRINGILVMDRSGQSQIWSIVEDITDSKQAEQALVTARDEADRANQAKSDFLSSMSHELRTPMNAILGFGQLMELDEALPDEHKDYAQEILKAGNHLLELINDVLDLAKVESGHIELSLEPVEVEPLITECLTLVSTLVEKRNIKINHSVLNGTAVRADRMRLKQVLLNLISNAIKYNSESGSLKLEVQAEGTERLRILITDTGAGIPEDRLTELFQPFNRLDAEDSNIEGTGIGLTITRRIVEMMGGSVDVESKVGEGSTFWIELPLESLPDSMLDHSSTDKGFNNTSLTPNIDTKQHVVLYIEDNPANLKLVTQILGRLSHIHLLTARTPELGIEQALAHRPELILLDINMPIMDGYQVLEIFKADKKLKSIPVIAITANAMPHDIQRGMAAGFTDYLTKPLDLERFHVVIDKLLSPNTTEAGTTTTGADD